MPGQVLHSLWMQEPVWASDLKARWRGGLNPEAEVQVQSLPEQINCIMKTETDAGTQLHQRPLGGCT